MAILLITHDLPLVRRFAATSGVMERGRVVERGDPSSIFSAPAHPYTQQAARSQPVRS